MTERQTKILNLVNINKKIEVSRLSEELGVSQVTIRKDLDILEEMDLLSREHGYAVRKNMDDIGNRLALYYDVKQKIAKAAAETVTNGETIMIESGSSCALLAEYLAENRRDITIITNSAFIAKYIRKTAGGVIKVILLGGEYQKEAEVMVGPLVKTCAREFYVDKLFIGTDGFIPGVGFTSGDMMRSEAMKSMAESANKTIILTDSSKFHEHGVVLQLRMEAVDAIFTDSKIPNDIKESLEGKGVKVEIADETL